MEIDATVCPICGSNEDTITYDERLNYELRLCDKRDCMTFYEVFYEPAKVKAVKFLKRKD